MSAIIRIRAVLPPVLLQSGPPTEKKDRNDLFLEENEAACCSETAESGKPVETAMSMVSFAETTGICHTGVVW